MVYHSTVSETAAYFFHLSSSPFTHKGGIRAERQISMAFSVVNHYFGKLEISICLLESTDRIASKVSNLSTTKQWIPTTVCCI